MDVQSDESEEKEVMDESEMEEIIPE